MKKYLFLFLTICLACFTACKTKTSVESEYIESGSSSLESSSLIDSTSASDSSSEGYSEDDNANEEEKEEIGNNSTENSSEDIEKEENSSTLEEDDSLDEEEDIVHYQHNYTLISTKNPTCTEQGEILYECTVCFSKKTDYTPKNGHSPKMISGYEPTCQKEGLTDGTICQVCNDVLLEQEPIATIAHDIDNYYFVCKWCDYFDMSCLGFEKQNNVYVCTGLELGAKFARRVVIPDTYEGLPVVGVARSAFKDHKELLSLELGANIEYINENAFLNCENLVEVYDRSKAQVTLREGNACGYLTLYTKRIQKGEIASYQSWVTKDKDGYYIYDENGDGIGEKTFVGYDGKETTLTIPEGVTTIKSYAFSACNTVQHIVLPNSLNYIEPRAFEEIPLLETITFKEPNGWARSTSTNGEYTAIENVFDKPKECVAVLSRDKYYYYKREA